MTLQSWLKLHHSCARGLAFVQDQTWETVWAETPRGDWLCYLLDSFQCPFTPHVHGNCMLPHGHEQYIWWQDFARCMTKEGVNGGLKNYWRNDNEQRWMSLTVPAEIALLWSTSAELIRRRYFELFCLGVAHIQGLPEPVFPAGYPEPRP